LVAVDARVATAQDETTTYVGSTTTSSYEEENENDFARRGAFAGVGFKWQVPGFQGSLLHQDYDKSAGFDARGGYRFFDWFSTEAIFEFADKFRPRARGATGPDVQLITTTVNAKFIVPLDRFQPYLETGIGFLYANEGSGFANAFSDNNVGFAGRIGAGIDLYLTRNVSLYVDNSWTMATNDTPDLYFYSLGGGARYNF
jgi:hypothetical protein